MEELSGSQYKTFQQGLGETVKEECRNVNISMKPDQVRLLDFLVEATEANYSSRSELVREIVDCFFKANMQPSGIARDLGDLVEKAESQEVKRELLSIQQDFMMRTMKSGSAEEVLEKLEDIDKRTKKMEAQHRKIINLEQRGGDTMSQEEDKREAENRLIKALGSAHRGIETGKVKELFGVSRQAALDKMKKLEKEYEWINYVPGRGNQPSKLYHQRFAIGGANRGRRNNAKEEAE